MVSTLTNWKLETPASPSKAGRAGNWKLQRAFTLIELLIAIAIVAVLSGMAISFSAGGSQKKANDARLRTDLKQYQTALEAYANAKNDVYPVYTDSAGVSASTTLCPTYLNPATGVKFLSSCPQDPKSADNYKYQSNNVSGSATQYVLWAKLETKSQNKDAYFAICSDGRSGTKVDWVNPSNGSCPL